MSILNHIKCFVSNVTHIRYIVLLQNFQ